MTRFEDLLLQDLMVRLDRMPQESRLSLVNAVQAALAGSSQAQELVERRVSATISTIQDNILCHVKDCLEYYAVGESVLLLIRDEFDKVSIQKITDCVIEELAQSF